MAAKGSTMELGSNPEILLLAALVAVLAWAASFRQQRDAPATSARTGEALFGVVAIAAAVATLVGSFGPWARVWGVFELSDASDPSGDARLWTAGCSAAAIILLIVSLVSRERSIRRKTADVAMLASAVATALGALTWSDVIQGAGNDGLVNVGWGLVMVVLGGGIGAIFAFLHTKQL